MDVYWSRKFGDHDVFAIRSNIHSEREYSRLKDAGRCP